VDATLDLTVKAPLADAAGACNPIAALAGVNHQRIRDELSEHRGDIGLPLRQMEESSDPVCRWLFREGRSKQLAQYNDASDARTQALGLALTGDDFFVPAVKLRMVFSESDCEVRE
jgi:hypothetical protein